MSGGYPTRPAAAASTVETILNPATKGVAIHATVEDNEGSPLPGPYTDPDVPRNVRVAMGNGYDGGQVVVTGTYQGAAVSEAFDQTPGSTLVGVKIFETIDPVNGITHDNPGLGGGDTTLEVTTGDKLGISAAMSSPVGICTIDGTIALGTFDTAAGQRGFTPATVLPNGARDYRFMIPL